MRALALALATSFAGAAVLLTDVPTAAACGCLSPPAVSEGEFAVNQQSEQIIFEVEPGWVTAHVLIKYAGDPASFAWIVPVPEVPELGISPASAFGILDQLTAPIVEVASEDICPVSNWACAYHPAPSCGLFGDHDSGGGFGAADAGAGTGSTPPVDIIDQQIVGDYQTVTFRANEAAAATQWLRDNGFVVNQTTSIYMESYVQQNMVFVAAKLIPGAGSRAIKPLRMRYRAAYPMVPLILTAVAAEPHLTVTSFIYSNKLFGPLGHPTVKVQPDQIARDGSGRINYPMVLARAIDDAGGDGFVIEYGGSPVQPSFGETGQCCSDEWDFCRVANDGQCQCPTSEIDAADCQGQDDLADGVRLIDSLAKTYTHLTRITTRVSAEEMTFDPQFAPVFDALPGRLTLQTSQPSLERCANQVIDKQAFAALTAVQQCATTYCGGGGRCVTTASGAACECDTGFVAQRFTDLDGQPSVTCIPRTPPVDLRANGEQLPDACVNVSCGNGSCVDRNGVAVCQCNPGTAAGLSGVFVPRCEPIVHTTATPGAQDFSDALRELDVCAPQPPICGDGGWLVERPSPRPGVRCGKVEPSPEQLRVPAKPTCGFFGGCGCQETPDAAPLTTLASALLVMLVMLRRRRDVRA
jgi:uncharacterized protein (TIGR03382 family)